VQISSDAEKRVNFTFRPQQGRAGIIDHSLRILLHSFEQQAFLCLLPVDRLDAGARRTRRINAVIPPDSSDLTETY